jgi:prephenate dehydrogenase
MKRLAIIGLGQIGGSIVLSLRKNQAPYHITGIDVSPKRLRLLQSYLDQSDSNWNAARDSEIVLLCLHYDQTVEFLQKASRDQLITDACSGKSKLMRLANRRKLRFIGGHPMAGNEFGEEKGWRNNLFAEAPYFLSHGKHATQKDFQEVRRLALALGARPIIIDGDLHDRLVAITSHFPAFLALLLKEMGEEVPVEFHGPGFRSMTRLASTSPALLNTFLQSNRANILRAAKQLQKQLDRWIFEATDEHR